MSSFIYYWNFPQKFSKEHIKFIMLYFNIKIIPIIEKIHLLLETNSNKIMILNAESKVTYNVCKSLELFGNPLYTS